MSVTSLYAVLMSRDVTHAATFYRDTLGFESTFASDWYVSMRLGSHELAILDRDHDTVPAAYRADPRGVLVNVEVQDVDAIHARLTTDMGMTPLLELRDEPFGQRHFLVAAPDDVLLDVIQPIPPSPEFLEAYATSV